MVATAPVPEGVKTVNEVKLSSSCDSGRGDVAEANTCGIVAIGDYLLVIAIS